LAGVVYEYKSLLIEYLEKLCNNQTSLKASILNDLKNQLILVDLQALGLWGKVLTGPWMVIFYTEDTKRNHFDMVQFFFKVINYEISL
jgi:hypothetical protein